MVIGFLNLFSVDAKERSQVGKFLMNFHQEFGITIGRFQTKSVTVILAQSALAEWHGKDPEKLATHAKFLYYVEENKKTLTARIGSLARASKCKLSLRT